MFPRLQSTRNIKKRSAHHVFSEIASEPSTSLDTSPKRARVIEDLEPNATESEVAPAHQDAPEMLEMHSLFRAYYHFRTPTSRSGSPHL